MAVQVDALAIALLGLLACIVALAIVQLARNIAEALLAIVSGSVGRLPLLGRFVDKGVTWAEQHLVNALTSVVNGLEGDVGFYWHALGNMATSIGNEIEGLSNAFFNLTNYILGVVKPWVVHTILGGLQHGVKWLRAELHAAEHRLGTVTKVIEHATTGSIGGAIHAITKPLAGEISAWERWTRTRIKALEHAADVVLPREIAVARDLAHEAERVYARLWAQVKRLERATTGALATALVVTALARIGAGWVACRNWNKVGRSVCRLPFGFLDDLLSLFADYFVLTNICRVIPWLEQGFSDVAAPLVGELAKAGAGLCDPSSTPPAVLSVPTLYLPSSVDLTLHLA